MDTHRKQWNERQSALREMLERKSPPRAAIDLFMRQHAAVHARGLSAQAEWYFAEEALSGLNEAQLRALPAGEEHSIVWCLWHLARIEDMTMNGLVAGEDQLAEREGWFEKLSTPLRHSGNAMDVEAVRRFSEEVNVTEVLAYRLAVGRRTEEIAAGLPPERLHDKVDPARLASLLERGAVLPEARGVLDYWGKRDVAGLLLMPPTRHCFVHLNEVERVGRGFSAKARITRELHDSL